MKEQEIRELRELKRQSLLKSSQHSQVSANKYLRNPSARQIYIQQAGRNSSASINKPIDQKRPQAQPEVAPKANISIMEPAQNTTIFSIPSMLQTNLLNTTIESKVTLKSLADEPIPFHQHLSLNNHLANSLINDTAHTSMSMIDFTAPN